MPGRKPALEDLRREIDGIDDALADLLARRMGITRDVARQKKVSGSRSAIAMRPAREAMILRRLLARVTEVMPAEAVVQIWREIISASLQSQTPFTAHVCAVDGEEAMIGLARGWFGATTPIRTHKRPLQVLHACAEEPYALGLVPVTGQDEGGVWWEKLSPAGTPGPRVVAKLPFLQNGEAPISAYVLGTIDLESSGDDTTLILAETSAGFGRTRLTGLLKDAGLDAKPAAMGQASGGENGLLLLEASGFIGADDARLAKLTENAGGAITRAVPVGGFANPVVVQGKAS